MASFDEGLAVGLLLGRKKGGGGTVYRDDIFHDIINNTTYLTGAEVSAEDYTVKVGAWISQQKYGRLIGGTGLEFTSHCQYAEKTDGTIYDNNYVYPLSPPDVNIVYVVFKSGTPIYAMVDLYKVISLDRDEYQDYTVKIPGEYEAFTYIYHDEDNYRIDSIQGSGNLVINFTDELSEDIAFPRIAGGAGVGVTYSYQSYYVQSEGEYSNPVKLVKSGDRSTKTTGSSFTFNNVLHSYGCNVFSDLTVENIISEMQGLYNSCLRYLGRATYPLTWITEEGIVIE